MITITKESLKEFALERKTLTGKFPTFNEWVVKNGYPCSGPTLKKLFNNSYNEFRIYCEEPVSRRTEEITVSWIKENCNITTTGCWEWLKGTMPSGYGKTSIEGKEYPVHKAVLLLQGVTISEGILVRHTCHNRICCNPEHLTLGTYSQNTIDSRNYSKASKLTLEQVKLIKQDLLRQDFSVHGSKIAFDKKWATQLNVSYTSIGHIRNNKSWVDVIL